MGDQFPDAKPLAKDQEVKFSVQSLPLEVSTYVERMAALLGLEDSQIKVG